MRIVFLEFEAYSFFVRRRRCYVSNMNMNMNTNTLMHNTYIEIGTAAPMN